MELAGFIVAVLLFWAAGSFAIQRFAAHRGIELGRYMAPAAAVMFAIGAILQAVGGDWPMAAVWVSIGVASAGVDQAQRAKAREIARR